MKHIAIIGAGISGLSAAYFLSRRHRVHLFEQEGRLGGHTQTVLVDGPNGTVPLDTGFLVHNDRTYPNLVRLFEELGVATRDSDMSFAVSCRRSGLEYSSRGANGFFAQRRNLVSPSHLALLREILRFNREAPAVLGAPDAEHQTLGDFLESHRFGEHFTHRYLFPMASAVWSASLDAIRSFPALTLLRFFDNHGWFSLHAQPTWKVVAGGSHTYVPRLVAKVSGDVHASAAIEAVQRNEAGVTIRFRDASRHAPSSVTDRSVLRQTLKSCNARGSARFAATSQLRIWTSRSPWDSGREGFTKIESTWKMTVPTQIPNAIARPPMMVSPGYFTSIRPPSFRSKRRADMELIALGIDGAHRQKLRVNPTERLRRRRRPRQPQRRRR